MKETFLILFALAACFCCFLQPGEATSCTSLSLYTCKKSEFMTGKCVRGVCECVSGYTPGPYGCQMQLKAKIERDFNGQIQTGASASLKCTPTVKDQSAYTWYKAGIKQSTTSQILQLNSVTSSDNGAYKCQVSLEGIVSQESELFTITVQSSFTTKPKVTGMTANILNGAKIMLTCDFGPKPKYYKWIVGTTTISNAADSTYVRDTVNADEQSTVKCDAGGQISDPVSFGAFKPDISGVEITSSTPLDTVVGGRLSLSCDLTGGFQTGVPGETLITYVWKRNGSSVRNPNVYKYEKDAVTTGDAGDYTCEAAVGQNRKTSQKVTVTVREVTTMKEDRIVKSSPRFLNKGYFSLTCNYLSVNTSVPVTYTWSKSYEKLLSVTDRILQFNDATDVYSDTYTCSVTSEDGTVTNAQQSISFLHLSDIENQSPWTSVVKGIPAVGNPVTIECYNPYYETPGLLYEWTVDGIKKTGEISKNFNYTLTLVAVNIKCAYTFGGYRTKDVQSSTIYGRYVVDIKMRVKGEVFAGSKIMPVAGTKVKIECDVTHVKTPATITYKWLEDSSPAKETSKYYEMIAGAADSKMVTVTCLVNDGFTTISENLYVFPKAGVQTPQVIINDTKPYVGTGIHMKCRSESNAEGATFEWLKNNDVITDKTSGIYKIDKVKLTADDGEYSCKIKVGGKTSATSPAEKLKVQDNEVLCKWAQDCTGDNFDKTVCYGGKCKCLARSTLIAGQCVCHGAATTVMGSLMMTMSVVLTQMFFQL